MSESPVPRIDFVPATAEDYEELMSISGGIYNGMDYLPFRYHAWLKDDRRCMFMAKTEGKIVGFESFLLVDGGETAVVEGLRVAPWMRGQGVAGLFQKFVIDLLHSDYPQVKRVRLTRAENPPPSMLKKFKVLHTKALVSMIIPFDQRQEAIRILESRLDNVGQLSNRIVLGPAEVLKLFEGTNTAEDLLPVGLLVQSWLPLTPQKPNLEMLFENKITWIYSPAEDKSRSAIRHQPNHENKVIEGLPSPLPSSVGFLSLGTPAYAVPYADAAYRFDINMFGIDPESAKMHVVEQLKLCIQSLPEGNTIFCNMFAVESLRSELNQIRDVLTPFHLVNEQMLLEMDI